MMFLVQIIEFKKRLNTVISACEDVRCFSNFGRVHMHFSLFACSSSIHPSGAYFTKAKRSYERDYVPGKHIEPRNCKW